MNWRPGGWEILIILLIVLLLFGPGRISKIAGELGQSIKSFREGLTKGEEDNKPGSGEPPAEPK
jgi:sec-independent protein translocase protein TatA